MKSKHKKLYKKYRTPTAIAVVIILISLLLSVLRPDVANKAAPSSADDISKVTSSSLELAMVGDMLPHETVTKAANTENGHDYISLISPELQSSFQKADLHFCNQEAVSAATIPSKGYPAFNAPIEFPRDINKFGCDIISTANNHAADQGLLGIKGTLEAWDSLKPLAISGMHRTVEESKELKVVEKNGIKVGFTAFNEVNNISLPPNEVGVNMLEDYKHLDQQIKGLRKEADVVVVSVHWGDEDSHVPTAAQKEYAKKISGLGADIIIGTGPHVWQPYQVLDRPDGGKTHVWNSIGNGLNSQTKQDQLFSGVALMNVSKDKEGRISISSPRVLPTYMHYVWGEGVGLSQQQLLARKDLKWTVLKNSQALMDQRNDFKTTEAEQVQNIRKYLSNDQVDILNSY